MRRGCLELEAGLQKMNLRLLRMRVCVFFFSLATASRPRTVVSEDEVICFKFDGPKVGYFRRICFSIALKLFLKTGWQMMIPKPVNSEDEEVTELSLQHPDFY